MSDTSHDLLAVLLQRRRDLELDAVAIKSRIEEIAELIDLIEHPRRRRARKLQAVETQPEPDNGDAAA